MGIIEYFGNALAERRAKREGISKEYGAAYRRCFDGTPEQAEIKLEAWDWVHRMTRHGSRRY